MLRPDAAAATDDLRPLLAPLQRHLRVLAAPRSRLVAPPAGGQIAEVRVDAKRQIGEVAQPRDHPGDVVGRHAVDRQGADADLLETPRRAAEGVALGSAPVLAVDAAHAVTATAKAHPHRQPGRQQRLDRRVGRAPHQRHRLDQDQVRRLLLEGPRQQPDRLAAVGGVDVAVDAERDRDLVAAAGLLGRSRASRTPCERRPSSARVAPARPAAAARAARSGRPRCRW